MARLTRVPNVVVIPVLRVALLLLIELSFSLIVGVSCVPGHDGQGFVQANQSA